MEISEYFKKKDTENYPVCFEGERVIFDIERIKADKDWDKLREDYKNFILENKDKVFTVEYDPEKKKNNLNAARTLVQLKEDTMVPKRLFWAGFLIPHKEDIKVINELIEAKEDKIEAEIRKKLKELSKYLEN